MAKRLTIYSTAHFLVDFCCALFLFGRVSGTQNWYLCLLFYNFCAFAMQMPFGVIIDQTGRPGLYAALGCLLVAIGGLLVSLPIPAAIVLGLGNALFHAGGGVDVIHGSREKAGPLGVFVSPGAVGLYLGTLLGRAGGMGWPLPGLVILLMGGLCAVFGDRSPAPVSLVVQEQKEAWPVAAMLAVFFVVMLRSYMGFAMTFSWRTGAWAVAAVLALALGKSAGGFLGDWLTPMRAAVASLSLCAVLFVFSASPLPGVLAIFLFNMTMPLTLFALARMLPGREGFAFGLLTFALFLGFLPVYVAGMSPAANPLFFTVLTAASLLLLVFGLLPLKKRL